MFAALILAWGIQLGIEPTHPILTAPLGYPAKPTHGVVGYVRPVVWVRIGL